jgi:cobalamin-dependent methionine synthase I
VVGEEAKRLFRMPTMLDKLSVEKLLNPRGVYGFVSGQPRATILRVYQR